MLLRFTEVGRVEQLLEANYLRAFRSRLADACLGAADVFLDVVVDRFLNYSDGKEDDAAMTGRLTV